MTDWSPARTSGAGSDDFQNSLLPVELAPMFAAASAPHTSTSSLSHAFLRPHAGKW